MSPAPGADPGLKVKYVSFNGKRLANAEQTDYGLKLSAVNLKVTDATQGEPSPWSHTHGIGAGLRAAV